MTRLGAVSVPLAGESLGEDLGCRLEIGNCLEVIVEGGYLGSVGNFYVVVNWPVYFYFYALSDFGDGLVVFWTDSGAADVARYWRDSVTAFGVFFSGIGSVLELLGGAVRVVEGLLQEFRVTGVLGSLLRF